MDKKNITRSISIIMLLLLTFMYVPLAHAAVLTSAKDTLTRLKAATTANHTIVFTTPTGIPNGNIVALTFPAGFNIASVVTADVTVQGAAVTTAAAAGQVLNITCGASNVVAALGTATIQINNNHITNPSVGTYVVTIGGGTFADTGSFQVVIITDDQVVMSGSIDASLTFSLSANASPLGTLTTGSIATSSPNITLTIGTNANSGYAITVKDQGNGAIPGLYNAGTTTYITSATAGLVAGTEGFGIQATQSGGATIAAPYTASGSNVGALAITPQSLATYATSTSANHTITITHKAAIATTTKAGSYADTITYIATANF